MNDDKELMLLDRNKYGPENAAHTDFLNDIIRDAHRINKSGTSEEKAALLRRIHAAMWGI